jgi:hypothetical protein
MRLTFQTVTHGNACPSGSLGYYVGFGWKRKPLWRKRLAHRFWHRARRGNVIVATWGVSSALGGAMMLDFLISLPRETAREVVVVVFAAQVLLAGFAVSLAALSEVWRAWPFGRQRSVSHERPMRRRVALSLLGLSLAILPAHARSGPQRRASDEGRPSRPSQVRVDRFDRPMSRARAHI